MLNPPTDPSADYPRQLRLRIRCHRHRTPTADHAPQEDDSGNCRPCYPRPTIDIHNGGCYEYERDAVKLVQTPKSSLMHPGFSREVANRRHIPESSSWNRRDKSLIYNKLTKRQHAGALSREPIGHNSRIGSTVVKPTRNSPLRELDRGSVYRGLGHGVKGQSVCHVSPASPIAQVRVSRRSPWAGRLPPPVRHARPDAGGAARDLSCEPCEPLNR